MLVELRQDLIKSSPADSLICIPVNTGAVAGKGLALYMKERWTTAHSAYVKACRRGSIATGDLIVQHEADGRLVAMIPTKYNWKDPVANKDLIRVSVARLVCWMRKNHVTSAHMPRLGCGVKTGKLDWLMDVEPIIREAFEKNNDDLTAYVYDWGK